MTKITRALCPAAQPLAAACAKPVTMENGNKAQRSKKERIMKTIAGTLFGVIGTPASGRTTDSRAIEQARAAARRAFAQFESRPVHAAS